MNNVKKLIISKHCKEILLQKILLRINLESRISLRNESFLIRSPRHDNIYRNNRCVLRKNIIFQATYMNNNLNGSLDE